MKKSILCRFAVIVAVLSGWGYSLFPLTDRPFYEVLRNEAKGKIDSRFDKVVEKAEKIDNSNTDSPMSPAAAVLNTARELKVDLRDYIGVNGINPAQ